MIDEKKLIDELKQSGMIVDNEYGNAMVDIIESQPQIEEQGKLLENPEKLKFSGGGKGKIMKVIMLALK